MSTLKSFNSETYLRFKIISLPCGKVSSHTAGEQQASFLFMRLSASLQIFSETFEAKDEPNPEIKIER